MHVVHADGRARHDSLLPASGQSALKIVAPLVGEALHLSDEMIALRDVLFGKRPEETPVSRRVPVPEGLPDPAGVIDALGVGIDKEDVRAAVRHFVHHPVHVARGDRLSRHIEQIRAVLVVDHAVRLHSRPLPNPTLLFRRRRSAPDGLRLVWSLLLHEPYSPLNAQAQETEKHTRGGYGHPDHRR